MDNMKILVNSLEQGKITRREFLTQVSALGLTAALSPALLSTSALAMTPKKGGRLRIGCPGGSVSETLNPTITVGLEGNLIKFGVLRNNLVELDYKGNLIPELAESWEPEPGAAKWHFKLRKGVEFHNGKPFEAEDVIYSINVHRGEDSKSPAKGLVSAIVNIKADGKYAVEFTLKEGNADFPFVLNSFNLPIVPNETTDFDLGIGTGPYILESFNPGIRTMTKRNPNYWKEGRAHFDEVEVIVINELNARISALTTKQVDVIARPDMKTFHLLTKRPGIQGIETTWTKHATFEMHAQMAPHDNNDVRLALKYAIDRQQFIDKILMGHGELGNDHPIGRKQRYYASELPQREYDPDKAKYHLKKAGFEGHKFKLYAADTAFQGAVDSAVLYKEQASKTGIDIEVVRAPNDGYWSNIWSKKPWFAGYWYGRPTEDWMFSLAYDSTAPWNCSHFKNARFDKLLKEARTELDQKKHRQIYAEMQKIVRDEGAAVIPAFMNDLHAATKKLKFENVAGNVEFDGMKIAERWWFES